jgi:hypothetical protein
MSKREFYTNEKSGVLVLYVRVVATKHETCFCRDLTSQKPQFSAIKERKACNKYMSVHRKVIIFVTNQEASGRRDRTYYTKRVSTECGGKKG